MNTPRPIEKRSRTMPQKRVLGKSKKAKTPSAESSACRLRGTKKRREASESKKPQIVALSRLPSGKEIKQLRQHLGLSATEFGKKFDVSRSTIKHYEGGSRKPNPRFAKAFWAFRDMTPRTSVRLITQVDLPPLVYVETPPMQCRGHGNYFFWADRRRVYCKHNKGECRKLWLRKVREENASARLSHYARRRARRHPGNRRVEKTKRRTKSKEVGGVKK
ncbi:MAG: helix-turn-helix domain-containing protein [Chloroflexi bacterium]|nr:helix-turn-helix domain-containing protein [Chloroflexota bacterium]